MQSEIRQAVRSELVERDEAILKAITKGKPETLNEWLTFILEWRKQSGFKTEWGNFPEKVMLIITELGRAVDAHREDKRELVEHELTDALIRFFDLLASLGIDVQTWLEKQMKNNYRRIHKHGKKY